MPLWSMDDWKYVERQEVSDPSGRVFRVAIMDLFGQEGDPELPSQLLEAQHASGRYFTLIYSESGAIQYERGHLSLAEATRAYERLLGDIVDGSLDPSQPVLRTDLED